MTIKNIIPGLLVVTISLLLAYSCVKFDPVSEVPAITFKSITVNAFKDSLDNIRPKFLLEFEFIDGDADIGISGEGIYDTIDSIRTNLFILPRKKIDSTTYVEIPKSDTIVIAIMQHEKLDRIGQNKTIKGIIRVDVPLERVPDYARDTFRYNFYIYDRALNRSNIENTTDLCLKDWEKQFPTSLN